MLTAIVTFVVVYCAVLAHQARIESILSGSGRRK